MAVFTDNFTGTDGDQLGSRTGWTLASGNNNGCEILSNQLRGVHTSTTGSGFTAPDTGSPDHYAQGRILVGTSNGFPLCCRLSDASNWGVGIRTFSSGANLDVYQRSGGSFTQLGSSIAITGWSTATVFKVQVVGTTITVYQDGVSIGTRTASVNASVQTPGVNQRSTAYSAWLDDWESDAVGGGATTYNDTVSDDVSLGDSTAGVATLVGAAGADNLTLGDAASGIATLTGALSDDLSLGDSVSDTLSGAGSTTYNDTVSDDLSLADSVVCLATLLGAGTDNITLGDALAGVATLVGAAADSLTLADSAASTAEMAEALSDNLALGDLASQSNPDSLAARRAYFWM